MSQLAQQLLNSKHLPYIGPINTNYNQLNQVPMPELLHNQSNLIVNFQNKRIQSKTRNLQESK